MDNSINRREFVRTFSMLAGASILKVGMPWLNDLQAQDTGRIVKLGIIGYGSRGRNLFLNLKDIPNLDMSCYCDIYEPNLLRAKEDFNADARGYYDYRELLEKEAVDALVVATPLHEHAKIVIDALQAGIHVFCEKTMARTVEDCNNMVLAFYESGKILHIGHQRMFDLKFQQAYKLIHEGKIGPVTQLRAYWHRNSHWRRHVPSPELERLINWRLYHEYSCGLLTELASHHIQVSNQILNQHPELVMGSGSINYWEDGREAWDNVNLVFKYPGGTHLVYDSLTSNKHYGWEIQVQGPKGTMELENGKMWDEFPPPAPGILQLINNLENKLFETFPIGGASWVPDSAITDKGSYIINKVLDDDGTRMQMEAFVANVRNNRIDSELLKQGFYASVASIMGYDAIKNLEIIYWPENLAM